MLVGRRACCRRTRISSASKLSSAPHVVAQRHHVDEAADLTREFRVVASRRRVADDDVLLPGIAVQQHLHGRDQHHEQRHAVTQSNLTQVALSARRPSFTRSIAPACRLSGGRTKSAGTSSGDRGPASRSPPIGPMPRGVVAGEPAAAAAPQSPGTGSVGLPTPARDRPPPPRSTAENSCSTMPSVIRSATMWWMLNSRTCRSGATRSSVARSGGPTARSNGRAASSAAMRRTNAAASAVAAQVLLGPGQLDVVADELPHRPARRRESVRSDS